MLVIGLIKEGKTPADNRVALTPAQCRWLHSNTEIKMVADMNVQFEKYKAGFIEELWKVYPGWASNQGYHKYDSILVVPNDASRKKELSFANSNLDSLKTYNWGGLSDNNKTDYYMIQNQLNSTVWSINELNQHISLIIHNTK